MTIRRRALGFVLVVLALLVVACSSESEQIQGTWLDTTGVYLEYDADGEYMVASGSDFAEPFEWGSYTFDGETLIQDTASDSPLCEGTSVTWTVVFSNDGDRMDLTFVEDSCVDATRSNDLIMTRQES